MNFEQLIFLPVETLAVIAAGYMAYRLAFAGLDQSHKAIDVLLISAIFALVARLGFAVSDAWLKDWGLLASVPLSFAITLVSAIVWRRGLSKYTFLFFRHLNVSHSDNVPSAWEKIIANVESRPFRIIIKKSNGTEYLTDLANHNHKPFGSCYLGSDGSVAVYVNCFRHRDDSEWTTCEDKANKDYHTLTYIPSEQIEHVECFYPADSPKSQNRD